MLASQPLKDYAVKETLGRGAFGTVKLAVHEPSGARVALKVISRSALTADSEPKRPGSPDAAATEQTLSARVAAEVRALRQLQHPHVMRLHDVIFSAQYVVLVLEYLPGGELFEYVSRHGRLPEAQARPWFQQIASAVAFAHARGIAHRDLKPENIFLDARRQQVKLGDFGFAEPMRDGAFLSKSCGTLNYAAPELIRGRLYSGRESDAWSLGVVLYVMLAGRLPFEEPTTQALFRKIGQGEYRRPGQVSDAGLDLLRRLLTVDPLQRMTVPQALAHPWVAQGLPPYLADAHDASTVTEEERILAAHAAATRAEAARLAAEEAALAADPGDLGQFNDTSPATTPSVSTEHLADAPGLSLAGSPAITPPVPAVATRPLAKSGSPPAATGCGLLDPDVVQEVGAAAQLSSGEVTGRVTAALAERSAVWGRHLAALASGNGAMEAATGGRPMVDIPHRGLLVSYCVRAHARRMAALGVPQRPDAQADHGLSGTSSLAQSLDRTAPPAPASPGLGSPTTTARLSLQAAERRIDRDHGDLGVVRATAAADEEAAPAPHTATEYNGRSARRAASFRILRSPASALRSGVRSGTATPPPIHHLDPVPCPALADPAAACKARRESDPHLSHGVPAPLGPGSREATGSPPMPRAETAAPVPVGSFDAALQPQASSAPPVLTPSPVPEDAQGSGLFPDVPGLPPGRGPFRVGIMYDDATPHSVARLVSAALKATGFVFRAAPQRPWCIAAVRCGRAGGAAVQAQLYRCDEASRNKLVVDLTLAAGCGVEGLEAVAELHAALVDAMPVA